MSIERGFRARIGAAVRPADLLAVIGIPVVMLLVFALPVATRESLAFSPDAPTLVSAYTAHFVHLDIGHLTGNLLIYALVVPATYLLSALAGYRRSFFVPFVTILLSFPFVLSALHIVLERSGRLLGFSGINMAFVGMVPLFETMYLSRLEGSVRLDHAPVLFFAGAALIAFRVVPTGSTRTTITLCAAAVALAYAVYAWRGLNSGTISDLVGRSGEFELAVGVVVVFFLAVVLGFPTDPTQSSGVVDVYTHFLGYAVGFVATYLVFRLDDPTSRPPPPPPPPDDQST